MRKKVYGDDRDQFYIDGTRLQAINGTPDDHYSNWDPKWDMAASSLINLEKEKRNVTSYAFIGGTKDGLYKYQWITYPEDQSPYFPYICEYAFE